MKCKVLYCSKVSWVQREEEVIEEAPLFVLLNGRRYCTLFRTPGEDEALLMGMCFTEGLIRERGEVLSIKVREDVAEVWTKGQYRGGEERRDLAQVLDEIKRRSFTPHKPEGERIGIDRIRECTRVMESSQRLRRRTEASHAVMLFSYALEPISMAEDVGRHNAFDKAIGRALMDGRLEDVFIATLSSRISFEMARKAAMVGVKILVGASKATSMAVVLGEELNMTVITVMKTGDVIVYSDPERLLSDPTRCGKGD
mgnify:CR=1 FL=1